MDNITKYMKFSVLANFFLSILKIAFGIISNMKSLVADGIHSFSDLTTDIIAIIGSKMSQAPADDNHPRGHGKIEYITSVIISCFIIFLSFSIFKNSFDKKISIPNIYLIIIVIITIMIKLILSKVLIRKGIEGNNMILISSGKESYTDVFSSILVLIVMILLQYSNSISLLKYSDMIGTIIISIMIFMMGIKLLFQNLSLLIGESERNIEKKIQIENIIKDRKDEFILDEYTIFKLGSYYEIVIKILVDGNMTIKKGHKLMDDIENDLYSSALNIKYVTIHIEPIDKHKN